MRKEALWDITELLEHISQQIADLTSLLERMTQEDQTQE